MTTNLLLCDIALIIKKQTGVWFGSMDIANALARGLCGEQLAGIPTVSDTATLGVQAGTQAALRQPVSMMLTLGRDGLKVSPNHLPAATAALNGYAETSLVTEAIVTVALMEVMRLAPAGVIVVTVSISGELSFETAGSLIQLIKRRNGGRRDI